MIGTTVSHYRIVDELGRGGMGVVYKARDLRLDRPAALKFLSSIGAPVDALTRDRFLQEAKACSALDHPNVGVIYEIGETPAGDVFMAMAYYEGQTLEERLRVGPLPIAQAVSIALQVARGLGAAHAAGIVHRDIKPSNIIITRDGVAKLIDFGVAKLTEATRVTQVGAIIGTAAYMSPEQSRGENVDRRTDVWSLGVVLYELLAGRRPFTGATAIAVQRAISDDAPPRLASLRPEVSARLLQVVDHALTKDPSQRLGSAAEFAAVLEEVQSGDRHIAKPASLLRRVAIAVAAGSIAIVALLAYWAYNIRWATHEALPEILMRADNQDYVGAFALARQADRYIAADPLLKRAWPQFSTHVSIETSPPGAGVYMKPYEQPQSNWEYLGTTPLANRLIPRGHFRWKIERAGYEVVEQARRTGNMTSMGDDLRFAWTLEPEGAAPAGMVRVEGTAAGPQLAGLDSLPAVKLSDFWIDRYEVTNAQFKRFVDAGGYRKSEYWKQPFVEDGREISWEEAMLRFRDTTGRPGPAGWALDTYPDGQGDHPVGGVSWYEAAAFAAFAGKTLPTVYQWSRAAGTRSAPFVVALSNIDNRHSGSLPVGESRGLSDMGAEDMAGNVKEWCWNADRRQDRYILGGAWNEVAYVFLEPDTASPWDRAFNHGFRGVKAATAEQRGEVELSPLIAAERDFATEVPTSDATFAVYRSLYSYDSTPLNAKVESVDASHDSWTAERVTFDAAYGGERVIGYLFIPKKGKPPYQTVLLFPGSNAVQDRTLSPPTFLYSFLLETGRAVFIPVYKGTGERSGALTSAFPNTSVVYRDHVIAFSKDLGRSIDYLETRREIDSQKLAYYGISWGASLPQLLAIERRFKAAVLLAAGLFATRSLPEVEAINFVPRVRVPVLMINGTSDFTYPPETSQLPLFNGLGTEPSAKRRVVFETNHMPVHHDFIRETLDWLDRYLGPAAK